MPEPEVMRTNARIQIETAVDGPTVHRVLIDGRDVSWQVRSLKFDLEGGEVADVHVTYARAVVSAEGDISLAEGGLVDPSVVQHG
jgi:hypothetical protein